jgi:hypothetical protein
VQEEDEEGGNVHVGPHVKTRCKKTTEMEKKTTESETRLDNHLLFALSRGLQEALGWGGKARISRLGRILNRQYHDCKSEEPTIIVGIDTSNLFMNLVPNCLAQRA